MLHPSAEMGVFMPSARPPDVHCLTFKPNMGLTYECGLCNATAQSQDQMKWYVQALPKDGNLMPCTHHLTLALCTHEEGPRRHR